MSVLALPTPARGVLRRFADASLQFLESVSESIEAARRYERLSRMSDAELARLGLLREDLPRFVFYGERRSS